MRWSDIRDAVFPAASGSARTIINSGSGKLKTYGAVTPADGIAGFAKGCKFTNTTDGEQYTNKGTSTSCSFKKLNSITNSGTAAGRGPSPVIWDECPVLDFKLDPTQGWEVFDDFIMNGPLLAASNTTPVTLGGGWWGETSATAGSTVAPQTDAKDGEIELACTTTDEVALLSWLCGHHTTGQVTFEAGKKTWFEARVKVVNVTNAKQATFCGFAEEGLLGDATLFNADQAVVDKDWIGFVQLPADGDAWQTGYNTAGGAGGVDGTPLNANVSTIVTTVYQKLGMYCDGVTVYFYVNGVLLADSIALTATDVPDGEELAFYFGIGSVDGADCAASIDWIRVAQEI